MSTIGNNPIRFVHVTFYFQFLMEDLLQTYHGGSFPSMLIERFFFQISNQLRSFHRWEVTFVLYTSSFILPTGTIQYVLKSRNTAPNDKHTSTGIPASWPEQLYYILVLDLLKKQCFLIIQPGCWSMVFSGPLKFPTLKLKEQTFLFSVSFRVKFRPLGI